MQVVGWRQFRKVEFDFHPQLTVLTGENGTGKTTLLNLLSPHFAWQVPFVAVPKRGKTGEISYFSGLRRHREPRPGERPVGTLVYSDGSRADLVIPAETGTSFSPSWAGMQAVTGLNIPSHRAMQGYQPVQALPPSFSTSNVLLEQFVNEIRQRYMGSFSGKTAGTWMKESLLAAAIFGEGNSAVEPNPEARSVWRGFQKILRLLLPESFGFLKLVVRPPEILIKTSGGEFAIDAASGGISALLELGWQIFLRSREQDAFIVCYDEPENHLHPTLQKSLMPSLMKAFPNVMFIVASHSPFIVTSVPSAHVYVLEQLQGAVESSRLDTSKARTADETLRRVLGVDSTLPLWAEDRLNLVLDRYLSMDLSSESLDALRAELSELGLDEEFPMAAAVLARAARDATPQ